MGYLSVLNNSTTVTATVNAIIASCTGPSRLNEEGGASPSLS